MSYLASSIQSTERINQSAIRGEFQLLSPHTLSIHILDDDSLLNVFYLYRVISTIDEHVISGIMWAPEGRWWHKLTHVCQRWRNLILGSASYLKLCLFCTYNTPVADMLAFSPPLPISIDFFFFASAEDVEGIILALKWRDRVRSISLRMVVPKLQNLIRNIDGEYPALQYLYMVSTKENESTLLLPETFQAPHLRHLELSGIGLPIGPRFLTTAMNLVTLTLSVGHPSSYFQPNILHQWLSFVPQLEKLRITFSFPVSNRDVERQLMHAPIMTTITLPNLHCFEFEGASAYMEAVIRLTTAPRLGKLGMKFKQRSFFVPSLLHFTNKSKDLKFDSAKFKFSWDQIDVGVYLREAEVDVLSINVHSSRLDWRATSVARVFNSFCQISQIFSTVEHLILDHEATFMLHYKVDRTEWRKLLRPFRNVKTLRIEVELVKNLSRGLQLDDGEDPLELLPKLEELTYSGSGDTSDAFTSFIDVRQNAGCPVTQVQVFRSRFVPSASSEAEIDLDT